MTISRRVFLSTGGRAAAALAVRPPLRAVDRGREQFALDHTDFEKLRASIKGALILPSDPLRARAAHVELQSAHGRPPCPTHATGSWTGTCSTSGCRSPRESWNCQNWTAACGMPTAESGHRAKAPAADRRCNGGRLEGQDNAARGLPTSRRGVCARGDERDV